MNAVVIITSSGKRILRKFHDEDMGEGFQLKAQKYFPNHKVYLVSLTNHIPPPQDYITTKMGVYWCPFCGEERRYYTLDDGDMKICPICHISTREYWVRNCNKIWPKAQGKTKKKARVKK